MPNGVSNDLPDDGSGWVDDGSDPPRDPHPRVRVPPAWADLAGDRRLLASGAVAVALAVALGAGVAWWRHAQPATLPPPLANPRDATPSYSPPTTARAVVVVDVVGAVLHPGVVRLAAGDRVIDALDAAGGPRADADVEQLDLAAKVVDGTRIAVPRVGEHVTASVGGANGDPGDPNGGDASGPVDLNTATEAQLESLPGIGPSLARAILAERDRRGGFRAVGDLGSVHGIGPKRLAELEPLVTV